MSELGKQNLQTKKKVYLSPTNLEEKSSQMPNFDFDNLLYFLLIKDVISPNHPINTRVPPLDSRPSIFCKLLSNNQLLLLQDTSSYKLHEVKERFDKWIKNLS